MRVAHMSNSLRSLLLGLVLVVAAAAAFAPGLGGRFLFDDYPNIVSNPLVHAESLSWQSLATAAKAYDHGAYGRPLATISFAVNYAFGGTDPYGYKLVSLAVHLANTLLVYLLMRALLAFPAAARDRSPALPFIIALVWAIHPIQVSSVLYVVQRMETLSLTFVLAALLAYLRGRRAQINGERGWPWLACCLPLVALGLLSKETAVLFPAYTLALEWAVLRFRAQSASTSRAWKWAYGLGAATGVLLFVAVVLPPYLNPSVYDLRNFTMGERLLTQLRVLPMYLGQMLLPLPGSMTFYYDNYPVSHGLLSPWTTLLGGAFLVALAATAVALRRRAPLASLGIAWFFAAHLLTSNVFALELVFEHRNYFALLGVLLTVADLVRRIPLRDGPMLSRVAVGAVVITLFALTLMRSTSWGNPLHLAMDMAGRNPGSARASNDLAEQYMIMSDGNAQSPFYAMAVTEFERGARLPDASPLPEQGLILMSASAGQPAQDAWWDSFLHKLRTRPLGPQEEGAVAGLLKHRNEGLALDDRRIADAYVIVTGRRQVPAYVYAQFGDHAIRYLGDDQLANRMFVAAIERNPGDATYAMQIFATLLADGHQRQAQAVWQRAQALGLTPNEAGGSIRPASQ